MAHEPIDTIMEMKKQIEVLDKLEDYLVVKSSTVPFNEAVVYQQVLNHLKALKEPTREQTVN